MTGASITADSCESLDKQRGHDGHTVSALDKFIVCFYRDKQERKESVTLFNVTCVVAHLVFLFVSVDLDSCLLTQHEVFMLRSGDWK